MRTLISHALTPRYGRVEGERVSEHVSDLQYGEAIRVFVEGVDRGIVVYVARPVVCGEMDGQPLVGTDYGWLVAGEDPSTARLVYKTDAVERLLGDGLDHEPGSVFCGACGSEHRPDDCDLA